MPLLADDDSNWDNDIDFSKGIQMPMKFIESRGIVARDPDKDLASAFARLADPYEDDEDDDDADTDSTFVSHHSDKLVIDEREQLVFPGLDDYMMQQPTTRGVVTRLGTHKRVQDLDDWTQDIHFPLKGLKSADERRVRFMDQEAKASDSIFDDDDDDDEQGEGTNKDEFKNGSPGSRATLQQQQTPRPLYERETDKETFDDIGFPEDMSTLSPGSKRQKKPIVEKEQDDDDFCKGLDIDNDDVFRIPAQEPVQRKRPSCIPRPVTPKKDPTPTAWSLTQTRQQRFRAPTYASMQRQVPRPSAMSSSSALPSAQPPPMFIKRRPPTATGVRRGASGATLMERPRSCVIYGNGSELDGLDILPEWKETRPRRALPKQPWRSPVASDSNASSNIVDPQRPWRHNMTRRKPTLIRPHEQPLQRECNGMRYDAATCRWQGNEPSILSFKNTVLPAQKQGPMRRRGPALITNMQKNGSSKYTETVVGSMVFDTVQMRWRQTKPEDDENILEGIEDLDDTPYPAQVTPVRAMPIRTPAEAVREFELSRQRQRQMYDEEETHTRLMKPWRMLPEEDIMLETRSGALVRAQTHMLFQ